ncbi:hypothetical protein [Longibacter salinarum]|nr:hypothetical protein [Longibacter salinarum]
MFAALLLFGTSSSMTGEEIGVFTAVVLGCGGIGTGLLIYLWNDSSSAAEDGTLSEASMEEVEPEDVESDSIVDVARDEKDDARGGRKSVDSGVDPESDDAQEPGSEIDRLSSDEEPWTVREEWRNGTISSDRSTFEEIATGRTTTIIGTGAIVVASGLLALSVWGGEKQWILAGVFGALGLLTLTIGLYRMRQRLRFGASTLKLNPHPGVLGGPFRAVLETEIPADQVVGEGVRVKLSCYRRRLVARGRGERDVRRDLLWRDEKQMRPLPSSGETVDVPVSFDLPADRPSSTPERTDVRYEWVLRTTAAVPGVDYTSVIEVPVFPVPLPEADSVPHYDEFEVDYDEASARGEADVERLPGGGLDIYFGPSRHPWYIAAFTVLTAAFGTGGYSFLLHAHVFSGVVFGMVALLFAWATYNYATHRSRITVTHEGVRIEEGALGMKSTTQLVADNVDRVTVAPSANMYQLHVHRVRPARDDTVSTTRRMFSNLGIGRPGSGESWNAYLERRGLTGHRVVAARLLADHAEAEWLASQIEQAAGEMLR